MCKYLGPATCNASPKRSVCGESTTPAATACGHSRSPPVLRRVSRRDPHYLRKRNCVFFLGGDVFAFRISMSNDGCFALHTHLKSPASNVLQTFFQGHARPRQELVRIVKHVLAHVVSSAILDSGHRFVSFGPMLLNVCLQNLWTGCSRQRCELLTNVVFAFPAVKV